MAPRVFVANFAGHDYAAAKKFGELKFVTKGFVSFQSLDRVKYQIALGLIDSKENDWLALSGTNIINAVAAVLWFTLHGRVKILNFDKNTGNYRELVLTRDSTEELLEVLRGDD